MVDTSGYSEFERLFMNDAAFAMTNRTAVLDDLPCTMALTACPRNTEKPLLKPYLAVSIAGRTACGTGTLLRPVAVAFGAGFVSRNFDLGCCAESGIFKHEIEIVSQIRSPLRTRAAPAASEEVAKSENVAENVAEIRKDRRIEAPKSPAGSTDAGMPKPVVAGAFLRVAQNRVSLGGFLEFFFRFLVPWVSVRMVLKRQFSVRALDFLVGGSA
jgi:hypothetical protein